MVSDSPLVTVFMAAYNARNYIGESIKSILSQTFPDFELLIVDDGSVDDTLSIVAAIRDSRIRVIRNIENRGLIFTRNLMLTEARGQFLAILDSDDVALPDRLEKQIEQFNKRPDLALIGGPAYIIDEQGKRTNEQIVVPSGTDKIKCEILFYNTFVHSSIMIKRQVFVDMGGYKNYPLAEDYDLMIRISSNHEVENLESPIVEYRQHSHNISKSQKENLDYNLLEIKKKQLREMDIEPIEEYVTMLLSHPSITKMSLQEYATFTSILIKQNRAKMLYPKDRFKKQIFDLWYEAILYRPNKKAFLLLFKSPIFNWKSVELRQIRRSFKISFKKFLKN